MSFTDVNLLSLPGLAYMWLQGHSNVVDSQLSSEMAQQATQLYQLLQSLNKEMKPDWSLGIDLGTGKDNGKTNSPVDPAKSSLLTSGG